MAEPSHLRILTKAAKSVLMPLGITQKGRSRTWLDDQRWWLGVIEFQPSSWSKGSYLNVGACWLWDVKDYLSFDHGNRTERFVSYASDEQFVPEAERLATRAKQRVLELRKTFKSPADVAKVMSAGPGTHWVRFHAGVAYGCCGEARKAHKSFAEVLRLGAEHDWQKDLLRRVEELDAMLSTPRIFRETIEAAILETRRRLKLRSMEIAGFCGND